MASSSKPGTRAGDRGGSQSVVLDLHLGHLRLELRDLLL
jgi:hypothetical protein